MPFEPGLKIGEEIKNDRLCEIYKCSGQGGMRRSKKTNTLVIVSKHVRRIYDDRLIGETLHYTRMGLEGDQEIHRSQNKTLKESARNGVELHLFEKFKETNYTFRGRVRLEDEPYEEKQPDEKGNIRRVWRFQLKLVEKDDFTLDIGILRSLQEKKEKKVKKLSKEELEQRIQFGTEFPGYREVRSKSFERNAAVSELAKRRANGKCQLCDQNAPFLTKDGTPYLETHHIIWLAKGGKDSPENTVAICPNCHRRMHSLNLDSDFNKLKRAASSWI